MANPSAIWSARWPPSGPCHNDAAAREDSDDTALLPSLRRIGLASPYAEPLDPHPDEIDGQRPLPLPAACPFTLDELLAEE